MYRLIFALSFSCVAAHQLHKLYQSEHSSKRDIAYSSSVFHTDPGYPDQHAEGSKQVHYTNYNPAPTPHHKSRSGNKYSYRTHNAEEGKPPPKAKHIKFYDQSFQSSNQQTTKVISKYPNTQSFNVGYSVSFAKGPKKHKIVRDEDPDIVRGTNKDVVRKPDEFSYTNVVSDLRKTRNKSKTRLNKYRPTFNGSEDPDTLLLSPKTKQSYEGLGRPYKFLDLQPDYRLEDVHPKREKSKGKSPTRVSFNLNPAKPQLQQVQQVEVVPSQIFEPNDKQEQFPQNHKQNHVADTFIHQHITPDRRPPSSKFRATDSQSEQQDELLFKRITSRRPSEQRDEFHHKRITSQSQNPPEQQKVNWKTLSPNIEIYHSPQLPPENFKFDPTEHLEQSKKFDHARALGRSQGFDYSNVVSGQNSEETKEATTRVPVERFRESQENFSPQQAEQSSASFAIQHPSKSYVKDFESSINQSPQIVGASTAALTANRDFSEGPNNAPSDPNFLATNFGTTFFQIVPQNMPQPVFRIEEIPGSKVPEGVPVGGHKLAFMPAKSPQYVTKVEESPQYTSKTKKEDSIGKNLVRQPASLNQVEFNQNTQQSISNQLKYPNLGAFDTGKQKVNSAVHQSDQNFDFNQQGSLGDFSFQQPIALNFDYYPDHRFGFSTWPNDGGRNTPPTY